MSSWWRCSGERPSVSPISAEPTSLGREEGLFREAEATSKENHAFGRSRRRGLGSGKGFKKGNGKAGGTCLEKRASGRGVGDELIHDIHIS